MATVRPSYRTTVFERIASAGIEGVEREKLMDCFKNHPRVKTTIALNELVAQGKIYFRNGIYRSYQAMSETAS